MAAPITSIDPSTGGVMIQWSPPVTNQETIQAYKIEILDWTSSVWTEDTADCSGANSVILANQYCIIPMSSLIAAPYSLTYGQLV